MDEAWPLPGRVEDYRDAYLTHFAPDARRRGMVLERVLLSPPMVLPDGGNRLTFIWSLADPAAFWAMRLSDQTEFPTWWERGAPLAERQQRTFHTDFAGEGA